MVFPVRRRALRAAERWFIAAALLAGCGGSGSTPTSPTAPPASFSVSPTRTATGAPSATLTQAPTATTPSVTGTASTPVATSTPTQTQATPTGTPPSSPTGTPGDQPTATPSPTVATPTPTATFDPDATGPIVSYLGMVRPDGCRIGCFAGVCACPVTPTPIYDERGREVFLAQGGGRGLLVVEGRPGASGLPVGSGLVPEEEGDRPDMQILVSQPLGNGSVAVCDKGLPPPVGMGGGVPPVDPPDFEDDGEMVTNAMVDLACRFAVQPSREDACTLDERGNFDFQGEDTTIQFCDQLATVSAFPPGDTVVTVRLRDVGGNLGPPAQVIVRNLAISSSSADE